MYIYRERERKNIERNRERERERDGTRAEPYASPTFECDLEGVPGIGPDPLEASII